MLHFSYLLKAIIISCQSCLCTVQVHLITMSYLIYCLFLLALFACVYSYNIHRLNVSVYRHTNARRKSVYLCHYDFNITKEARMFCIPKSYTNCVNVNYTHGNIKEVFNICMVHLIKYDRK